MRPVHDLIALGLTCVACFLLASLPEEVTPARHPASVDSADQLAALVRDLKDACTSDVEQYCAAATAAPMALKPCMQAHAAELRPTCRTTLQRLGLVAK